MLTRLKFLTAGESHGQGLLGILDGMPAGIEISENYIAVQLTRRQMGHGRGGRMKIEKDFGEIWCGVRHGKTLGAPVGIIVQNKDWENWTKKMSISPVDDEIRPVTLPRPGHADLAGIQKYGFNDIRNVLERSSARETTMRVALGSVCRKLLEDVGIEVGSRVVQIHDVKDKSSIRNDFSPKQLNETADASPVRCLDKDTEAQMIKTIDDAKSTGDSVGGVFEVIATGLPYGLGSYTQWDQKLHTRISALMMSVNAFKGIEIGKGFGGTEKFGSEIHDEIGHDGEIFSRYTNNAGGIEGGMSNAQPIILHMAMKPIPTLIKPLRSVDIHTKESKDAHKERTDSCAVPAASIIAESMLCFVLADALLEKFGGDSMDQLKAHMEATAKY
ncbi:MAG: chorismate synthase [Candidatus Marinimicrobia bacterium]|jgi:chorismate synthase|nr:chorismate synthase [Candidatus Neomarinimicrobiota bacterium]MBT3838457.1 chorismate synthase [Candidatus Neomarinimicrobiota bacterium]MBT3998762.1 chorismate synthase [Candidatus Neomarinimicrobiota bacterium]MBT4283341.1 chorismate synthase [Candidatus Neomarinimicrobiota bacterium]MBT4578346.1 chorismate synthase [Candidatus Neomarinimicrobiota bacterium]